MSYNFSVYLL